MLSIFFKIDFCVFYEVSDPTRMLSLPTLESQCIVLIETSVRKVFDSGDRKIGGQDSLTPFLYRRRQSSIGVTFIGASGNRLHVQIEIWPFDFDRELREEMLVL